MFVYMKDGVPTAASGRELRSAFPDVSLPSKPAPGVLEELGVYKLEVVPPPAHDTTTQKVVMQDLPTELNGVWAVRYDIVPKSLDEQAEAAEIETYKAAKQALKGDTPAKQLLKASPEQINSYIENNVTNLESAKDVLKILARALAVVGNASLR